MRTEIRDATVEDVGRLVELSALRREAYGKYAPLFWRPAPDAAKQHREFLSRLVTDEARIALVCELEGRIQGFLIADVVSSPPVYDPGGTTCLIDDFAVEAADLWATCGRDLLDEASARARDRGAVQVVVVTAALDQPKRRMLTDAGLEVASEWFTQPLQPLRSSDI